MEILDVHDVSRRAGLPVVSVGVGSSGDVLAKIRAWAATHRRPVVLWRAHERDELGARMLAAIGPREELESRARRRLGSAGFEPDDVVRRRRDGPEETLLQARVDGSLRIVLGIASDDALRLGWNDLPFFLKGLASLCAEDDRPLLLALAEPGEALALSRCVCELVTNALGWPIAMCVTEGAWREVEATLGEREVAILRHGFFEVAPSFVAEPCLRPVTQARPEGVQAQIRALHELGVASARLAAMPSWVAGTTPSAPEQFLADVLDDLVATAGLFEMHGKLPVQFGPRPMEVDLLCRRHRVAVEIDGMYHFTDPEHYRRDRRKDALLQKHGYLVLRFLAEDVVSRLEEIIAMITDSFRRGPARA